MVEIMANLLAVAGLNITPPTNMAELIPYLLKCCIAFCIVGGILGWVKSFSNQIMRGKF